MKEKVDCIIKSGIVESIGHKYIRVRIHTDSACQMCYSKGVCTSMGSGERVVEVESDGMHSLNAGDRVDIQMISRSGILAVLFGYIFPFILLLSTLLICSLYTTEGYAALISISALIPYFLILYAYRNRMKKFFRFTLL